jgi:hypothetical protein
MQVAARSNPTGWSDQMWPSRVSVVEPPTQAWEVVAMPVQPCLARQPRLWLSGTALGVPLNS